MRLDASPDELAKLKPACKWDGTVTRITPRRQ